MNKQTSPASAAGTVTIGDSSVNRLGFGAMRLPGPGVWGEPADRAGTIALLRRAVDLGINLIDTAPYYGDHIADGIIADALYPYDADLFISTKVGARREPDTTWVADARPETIRTLLEQSLTILRREWVDLVHYRHMAGTGVPMAESLGTLVEMQREGKVRNIGVSNVTLDQVHEAQRMVPLASVQNRYNVEDRTAEDVVQWCEAEGVPYMPYFPLAIGKLGTAGGAVAQVAQRHGVTTAQVALAWLLARSPVMLPIPGTSSVQHLEENVDAASLRLTPEDMRDLNA